MEHLKIVIKMTTENMPKKMKLELITAADNIPTVSQKSTLLKSAVQNVTTTR